MSENNRIRIIKEKVSSKFMLLLTLFISALLILMLVMLISKSSPVISHSSLKELLFSSNWNPERYKFGFFPAIVGTFIVTIISLLIAVPISILSAIYLAEYAPPGIGKGISSFIDVLAGIPSVVFGLSALLALVPFVSNVLGPLIGIQTTGMCIFTASIVLAIMVFPIIINLCTETLKAIPVELREASLSLGATKWETIKYTLLKAGGPGIFSAVLLGFGRAFGETMAVAMVIGSKNQIPSSIFKAAQTLPSLLVSSFGEMMSVPLEQSALIFIALVLFLIVLVTNIIAAVVKRKIKEKWRY